MRRGADEPSALAVQFCYRFASPAPPHLAFRQSRPVPKERTMPLPVRIGLIAIASALTLARPSSAAPPPAPFFTKLNHGPTNLRGYVDLHAHLMNHLAFGGHLLHGAPDVDVLMPAGTLYNGANA